MNTWQNGISQLYDVWTGDSITIPSYTITIPAVEYVISPPVDQYQPWQQELQPYQQHQQELDQLSYTQEDFQKMIDDVLALRVNGDLDHILGERGEQLEFPFVRQQRI